MFTTTMLTVTQNRGSPTVDDAALNHTAIIFNSFNKTSQSDETYVKLPWCRYNGGVAVLYLSDLLEVMEGLSKG